MRSEVYALDDRAKIVITWPGDVHLTDQGDRLADWLALVRDKIMSALITAVSPKQPGPDDWTPGEAEELSKVDFIDPGPPESRLFSLGDIEAACKMYNEDHDGLYEAKIVMKRKGEPDEPPLLRPEAEPTRCSSWYRPVIGGAAVQCLLHQGHTNTCEAYEYQWTDQAIGCVKPKQQPEAKPKPPKCSAFKESEPGVVIARCCMKEGHNGPHIGSHLTARGIEYRWNTSHGSEPVDYSEGAQLMAQRKQREADLSHAAPTPATPEAQEAATHERWLGRHARPEHKCDPGCIHPMRPHTGRCVNAHGYPIIREIPMVPELRQAVANEMEAAVSAWANLPPGKPTTDESEAAFEDAMKAQLLYKPKAVAENEPDPDDPPF